MRAYGLFSVNGGGLRQAKVSAFWGGAQTTLVSIQYGNSTAVDAFELEFEVVGVTGSSAYVAGYMNLGDSVIWSAQGAVTGLSTGAQTLDLQFCMSSVLAGEYWQVNAITMERLK